MQVSPLFLFKLVHVLNFGIFLYFISDHRKKEGVAPLVNEKLTLILKLSRAITGLTYMHLIIFRMTSVTWFDGAWVISVLLGTFVVAKSRSDLKTFHTWAGFRLKKPILVTNGIYSYMRHPIYVGIFFFVLGAFMTTVRYAPLPLLMPYASAVLYILTFLPIMAGRETEILEQELGPPFVDYKRQVHAFLPLKLKSRIQSC